MPKIAWKRVTGVALRPDRVVAVIVGKTPAGPRAMETVEAELGERTVTEALTELREQGALKGVAVFGLDPRHVYFSTLRATDDPDATAADEISRALSAIGRSRGELIGDVQAAKLPGGRYVSLAACKKQDAKAVMAGLEGLKPTKIRLEPTSIALCRLAQRRTKPPRRWKTFIRVLVDGTTGLAVLCRGKVPLACRNLALRAGAEVPQIATAALGLMAHARSDLELPEVDGILLHGDGLEAMAQSIAGDCGLPTEPAVRVALDAEGVAFALGASALQHAPDMLNMFKPVNPEPSLAKLFPWSTAAIVAAVVMGSGMMVSDAADKLEAQARTKSRTADKAIKSTKTKKAELKKNNVEMMDRATAVSAFVEQRVRWGDVLREISQRLPTGVVLSSMRGRDTFSVPDRKRKVKKIAKRELSVRGELRVPRGDPAAEIVPEILDELMASETISTDFPRAEGAKVLLKPGHEMDNVVFVGLLRRKRK